MGSFSSFLTIFGLPGCCMHCQSPPGRRFKGMVGEVLAFNRTLTMSEAAAVRTYLYSKWGATVRPDCTESNKLAVVGRFPLLGATSTYWQIVGQGSTPNITAVAAPKAAFMGGLDRAQALGARVRMESADLNLNAATSIAAAAVDGLYRGSPGLYVHGAMAWDVPYVGWRSEYGGT